MHLILCSLSSKRRSQLEAEPRLFFEVLGARKETAIPGLLDLGKTWDALDFMLSGKGKDALLGDALLARTGRTLRISGTYGRARLLEPPRVAGVSAALAALPAGLVRSRYPELLGLDVHGAYGQETCNDRDGQSIRDKVREGQEREITELERVLAEVAELYERAAAAGSSMLSMLV